MNTRKTISLAIAAMLLMLAAFPLSLAIAARKDAPADAHHDDTHLTKVPPSKPLGKAYQNLVTKSIFSRDHRAAKSLAAAAPTTAPDTRPSAPVDDSSPLSENNITLRGITSEDGAYTAFFEDSVDSTMLRVRVGDRISHGRIAAMTLDGIDYSAGGSVNRIAIGQSLAGGRFVATTQPSTSTGGASTSQPSTTSGGSVTSDKPKWWRH